MKHWAVVLMVGWIADLRNRAAAADVGLIKINGAIGPATADYIARAIDVAAERENACLIIELDTPGGSLDSTKEIVQKFYASTVPTVVYVAPDGAWAGSAGCFITLAADVAAMAPGTSIGAAHPVAIGPGGEEKTSDVMKEKLEKYHRQLHRGHRREARAQRRVGQVLRAREQGRSRPSKALELKVIDLIAKDLPDLLSQLDGREVNGKTLKTAGRHVVDIPMTIRERVLQMLCTPR